MSNKIIKTSLSLAVLAVLSLGSTAMAGSYNNYSGNNYGGSWQGNSGSWGLNSINYVSGNDGGSWQGNQGNYGNYKNHNYGGSWDKNDWDRDDWDKNDWDRDDNNHHGYPRVKDANYYRNNPACSYAFNSPSYVWHTPEWEVFVPQSQMWNVKVVGTSDTNTALYPPSYVWNTPEWEVFVPYSHQHKLKIVPLSGC